MTFMFIILIIALAAAIGFYFMDHCGKFMAEHYNASPDSSAFKREKKKTTCDTMISRVHLFRKG